MSKPYEFDPTTATLGQKLQRLEDVQAGGGDVLAEERRREGREFIRVSRLYIGLILGLPSLMVGALYIAAEIRGNDTDEDRQATCQILKDGQSTAEVAVFPGANTESLSDFQRSLQEHCGADIPNALIMRSLYEAMLSGKTVPQPLAGEVLKGQKGKE